VVLFKCGSKVVGTFHVPFPELLWHIDADGTAERACYSSIGNTMKSRMLISLALALGLATHAYGQDESLKPSSTNVVNVDGMWGFQSAATYKVLPRPKSHSNKGQPNTYVAPRNPIESKPMQPYAYGWFGTKPSPHWHRQFGAQAEYTQWTLR
jgi:hypothetical protein